MKAKKLLTLAIVVSAVLGLLQTGLNNNQASASAISYEHLTTEPDSGSITAHKFNDVNENGVQDEGEENITGWLFRLYQATASGLSLTAEGTTGPDGSVTFANLPSGWYKLWEELPECWAPTYPGGSYWNGGYYVKGELVEGQQADISIGNIYSCTPPPQTCIDLEKTGPEAAYPGDTVTYHFWVHNCGDIILAGGAHVYDLLFGEAAIWDGDLEPDEIDEFDMEYTLPDNLCDNLTTNTEFVNNAWAIGHPPGYPDVRDDDSWTIEIICGPEPSPSIDIEKHTNGEDADEEPGPEIPTGDTVTWEYIVSNSGNVPLTDIAVTDDALGEICTIASLAVGQSQTCTANGIADVGQYENIGTVEGYYGDTTVSDEDPSHYFGYVEEGPSITIEKSTNGEDADEEPGPEIPIGNTVTWEYVVTNNGNVPLTDIVVTDDILGEICAIASLAVEQSETCTANGTAEVGQYENIGTVEGYYGDTMVSDEDPSHYFGYVEEGPSITIEKFTNGEDADTAPGPYILAGGNVDWEYVVTNNGNVPLTDIVVTDDVLGQICTIASLAVEQSETCTANGIAEVGQYENIGTAEGYYGDTMVSDEDPSHYFGADPAIDIEKFVSIDDQTTWLETPPVPEVLVGNDVYFRLLVTNTGNVPLTDIALSDPSYDVSGCDITDPLPVDGSFECIIGPFAAEEGLQTNTATVTGDYSDDYSEERYEDSDQASYFGAAPAISIEKSTNGEDADTTPGPYIPVGQEVIWEYVVTNTGNVPLSSITVTDDQGVTVSCPQTALVPDEEMTCTANGTAVLGQYENLGTAAGTSSVGANVSDSDYSHYLGVTGPGIAIEKRIRIFCTGEDDDWEDADTEPGPLVVEGTNVFFQFEVTNIGNVPLTNITLSDNFPGFNEEIADECGYIDQLADPEVPLDPGESFECTIGPFPAEQGQHTNSAIASGDYNERTYKHEDEANFFGIAVDVEKYVSIDDGEHWDDADTPETGPEVEIGDNVWVWFRFVVTNLSSIPVIDVTLSDSLFNSQINSQCIVPDELDADESFTCEIGPLQATAGEHVNTATASGYYMGAYCPGTSTDTDDAYYLGVESGGAEEDWYFIYMPLWYGQYNWEGDYPPGWND